MQPFTRILDVPNRYRRITGQDLSAALDRLQLSAGEFARGIGSQRKRVLSWLEDKEEIPHSTTVIVRFMEEFPEGKEFVREVADEMIIEEEI